MTPTRCRSCGATTTDWVWSSPRAAVGRRDPFCRECVGLLEAGCGPVEGDTEGHRLECGCDDGAVSAGAWERFLADRFGYGQETDR